MDCELILRIHWTFAMIQLQLWSKKKKKNNCCKIKEIVEE